MPGDSGSTSTIGPTRGDAGLRTGPVYPARHPCKCDIRPTGSPLPTVKRTFTSHVSTSSGRIPYPPRYTTTSVIRQVRFFKPTLDIRSAFAYVPTGEHHPLATTRALCT